MVRVTGGSRERTVARLLSRASRSTSTQAGRSAASRSSTPGAAVRASVSSEGGGGAVEPMPVQVAEGRSLPEKHQLDRAGLAVAVLGNDQLGEPLVLLRGVVHLVAVDERHHVCVLFERVVDEDVPGDEVVRSRN